MESSQAKPSPATNEDSLIVYRGRCSCGAVQFEARGRPLAVGVCHCLKCRKATGSAFFAYAHWPYERFVYSGKPREFAGRSFCPNCGTRLFHLSEEKVSIAIGALDDAPTDLVPTREGWIKRRESWLQPVEGAIQATEDPPQT
jgi:hypothetical protein